MTTDSKQPDYIGHRQRLRDRFLADEGKDMADYEMLELVLTMAIPRRDVKPLAKHLISRFGSFAGVINAPAHELLAEDGVKENTLTMFKVIRAASLRTSWQALEATDQPILAGVDVLVDYCRSAMCFTDVEELRVIFLDAKLRLLCQEVMSRGTINQVLIHPREIIKAAMVKKAAAIILVHNHPSGDVTPSQADIDMTKQVELVCKTMNIKLCEHIIISRYSYYSFHNEGFIE